jgi:hypothetical protein
MSLTNDKIPNDDKNVLEECLRTLDGWQFTPIRIDYERAVVNINKTFHTLSFCIVTIG